MKLFLLRFKIKSLTIRAPTFNILHELVCKGDIGDLYIVDGGDLIADVELVIQAGKPSHIPATHPAQHGVMTNLHYYSHTPFTTWGHDKPALLQPHTLHNMGVMTNLHYYSHTPCTT